MNTRQLRQAIYAFYGVSTPRQLRKRCTFSKDFDLRCKGHLLALAQMAKIPTVAEDSKDASLQEAYREWVESIAEVDDAYFEWQAGLTAGCDMFSNPVQPSVAA